MKKISLLIVCLSTLFGAHAQSVTIIDDQTLLPIQGVQVFKWSDGYPFTISGEDGVIQLKDITETNEIYFIKEGFMDYYATLSSLQKVKFVVKMHGNLNEMQEVVVSASRFEEKKKDVSQKIQIINAREIENMNQTSTADVLANSGNVMVQKSQLGGGSPIIRGFETNKVLIVLDGIRMNNAIYRG